MKNAKESRVLTNLLTNCLKRYFLQFVYVFVGIWPPLLLIWGYYPAFLES